MSRDSPTRLTPERFTAFVDAVVAIAMTLLILPLMEAVSEAADAKLSTAQFFSEHRGPLISFTVSFTLIAMFWMEHHRVYAKVRSVSTALVLINVLWLFTIVWLPVPTAMLGQMPMDALQATVYIGSLIVTQLATLAAKVYLLRNGDMSEHPRAKLVSGIAGDLASTLLFGLALVVAVGVPTIGYFSLLLTLLTGPVSRLVGRLLVSRVG